MEPVRDDSKLQLVLGTQGLRELFAANLSPKDLCAIRSCGRQYRILIDQAPLLWKGFFDKIDVGFVPTFAPDWLSFAKKHVKILNQISLASRDQPFDRNELVHFQHFPLSDNNFLPDRIRNFTQCFGGVLNTIVIGNYAVLHIIGGKSNADIVMTVNLAERSDVKLRLTPLNSVVAIHEGGLICAQSNRGMMKFFHIKGTKKIDVLFRHEEEPEIEPPSTERPRVRPRIHPSQQSCIIL